MPRKKNNPPSLRQRHFREYQAWINAIHRCHNPRNLAYKRYGARGGIEVCGTWRDAENGFQNFFNDVGVRPEGDYSLERIDGSKGYSPDNCIWADRKTQQNNRSGYNRTEGYGHGVDRYGSPFLEYRGEIKTLATWAQELGIKAPTIRQRLERGMTVEQALSDQSYRSIVDRQKLLTSMLVRNDSPTIH